MSENEDMKLEEAGSPEDSAVTEEDQEHHHHHHHHHHHRSSKERKRQKRLAFLKKNRFKIANIAFLLAAAVIIASLLHEISSLNAQIAELKKSSGSSEAVITEEIDVTFNEQPAVLVNDLTEQFMKASEDMTLCELIQQQSRSGSFDYAVPLSMHYSVKGNGSGSTVRNVRIEVSEQEDYSDAFVYQSFLSVGNIEVTFLKTGCLYHYRVTAEMSDSTVLTREGEIATAVSPRILSVDGIVNVRDVGGWQTESGETIREGLLIRGSELDGAVSGTYRITDQGAVEMLTRLGIRYDMDLRAESDKTNEAYPLGRNVIHKYYDSYQYSDVFSDYGKEVTKTIFRDLADPDHYPMYLHCTYGTDRTGTICYILEALLGVSDQDRMKEFELSCLRYTSNDVRERGSEFLEFVSDFKELEGSTAAEKAENYLLSAGVSAEEIRTIREIFLSGR